MHSTHLLLEEPIRMASILEPSKSNFFPAMTKIVGTLGPKSRSVEVISGCLKAGMSVARFDFSWGNAEYHQETLTNLKTAVKSTNKLCAVMLDTVGPELQVVNKNEGSIFLEEEALVVLTPDQGQEATSQLLPINFSGLGKAVKKGDTIFLGQYLFTGSETTSVWLEVSEVKGEDVVCVVKNSAKLAGALFTLHVSQVHIDLPTLTDKDKEVISTWGVRNNIDFISLSYTRHAEDVRQVRIWNMKCVSREPEKEQSTQKMLATLRDHFGSVNCVRWAKHGQYLASGSDDQVILIHERKPGSGTTEFGSGEPADVENWKVKMNLRGHTADVVDLNWSPDDSILASGSLDNTIHIWNMSNGLCSAVLRGHSSLVKGVAWDPIGSFIASQSDDKTVIIWKTSDWSLAHRTEGHWAKSLGSTFFRRLGWSPCGHFITTTHGFQKPRHSAPVLERGNWSATFDFLGHNAPIIVVKFNHSMFRKNASHNQEVKSASTGWSNGSSKTAAKEAAKELLPYNVIAIGSQDRTITVWTTASARPIFVAKHFFTQSVVDLSWSPDGYSLFACSLDGTVAIFHLEVKELGHRLSDSELDELKKNRYGDIRGRLANLAETPAQLFLEAASVKQSTSKTEVSGIHQNLTSGKSYGDSGIPSVDQSLVKESQSRIEDGKKNGGTSSDGLNKVTTSTTTSAPVKQTVYRRSDGRKRIIPEALGAPANQENDTGGAQPHALDFPHASLDQAKDDNRVVPTKEGSLKRQLGGNSEENNLLGKCSNCGVKEHAGVSARAAVSESLIIEKVPASKSREGAISIEHPAVMKPSGGQVANTSALSIRVFDKREDADAMPVCLEARQVEKSVHDVVGIGNAIVTMETEVTCMRGTEILWSDRIPGKITVLAGNTNFWAVGCEDGCLQVYTKCGRRAMPPMMMGSSAIFIDCDECWKLLLVTKKGLMYVWDLVKRTCLLHESLDALVTSRQESSAKDTGTIKVISARFSKSGSPLVILATRHAFLFDINLRCWLRIADDSFPASSFASSWNLGSVQCAELAALQVDVGKFLARKPSWSRATDDLVQTRAHLEAQLASSLTLQSPNEYRQCLLSYIRFLAREGDESRLRELCESFLGPPTGMVELKSSEPKNPAWDPCVLGMQKHKLLKEDILPAMASNRKVQRLLNEYMDVLSEYEDCETNKEQLSAPPPATDQLVSTQHAKDQTDPTPPSTDQVDQTPIVADPSPSVKETGS